MGLTSITEAISGLKDHGVRVTREPDRYSFGNREQCRKIFEELFLSCDKTVKEFKFLPEYENILQWMMDTKGTGLCLVGDCGRGKSTILTGVIPTLFYMRFNKIIRNYQAGEIPDKINDILTRWAIMIDEIGTEIQVLKFENNYEGFNRIMDEAEARMKLVFITTNLKKDEIINRYGIRTWERINRLCRIVQFKGESLR